MRAFALLILFIFFITGCSSTPSPRYDNYSSSSNDPVVEKLYEQYQKWHHTPYRYGGLNLKGVDCSGLAERVYKDGFGLTLPRTTKEQMHFGIRVSYSKLKAGDLLFFKTGFSIKHVGIYFGKRKFMHASKTYGVIISSMNNPYWNKRFLTARRVLRATRAYTAKH